MKATGKLKPFFVNISLTLFSLFLLFIVCECIVFRFILIAADMPQLDYYNDVVKYKPNQKGTYRVKNEIKAIYKINSNGWNSKYSVYQENKTPNKYRIAVIGDSYVEAFQVDFNASLAERLEKKLGPEQTEVFRFGISGAPMSQYLHLLRKEVVLYRPDLVVVILVHNDFQESYQLKPGVFTSSFLKLKLTDRAVLQEIAPQPYKPAWYSGIRRLSTWRYLVYRQKIQFQTIRNVILGRQNEAVYQANVDVRHIAENNADNRIATEYIIKHMKAVCEKMDSTLLIVIDGDRNSIYRQKESDELYKEGALSLNSITRDAAKKYAAHFIDMHPVFEKKYMAYQQSFNFKTDNHWNAAGHSLVSATIADYIKRNIDTGFEK